MVHFEIPKIKSSIIKVIGVGGGGGNAVNYMYKLGIEGVDFIVCNTDSQALAQSPIPNKIQLGPNLTQGLGAGANPEIGKQAGEESIEEIKRILQEETKMAFITAGMGGGTGTGGAPIIAKVCRELDILTVGIVTTPFTYEGRKRLKQAQEGINAMKEYVDTILIISNDKLRQQYGNIGFTQAFAKADNILSTAAKCITDLITVDGKVNLDFNDVQTVMRKGGRAILGSAQAEGEDRAIKAVTEALDSPLLNDSQIEGAKWILLNVTSGSGEFEHTLDELEIIQEHVQDQAGNNCDIILGMGHDSSLEDKISVTIIATGFHYDEFNIEKKTVAQKKQEPIIVALGDENAAAKLANNKIDKPEEPKDPYAPTLNDSTAHYNSPAENIARKQPKEMNPKNSFKLELPSNEAQEKPVQKSIETNPHGFELIIKDEEEENKNQEGPETEIIKIGERILTKEEIEERRQFEEQKRKLEERAERIRRMSFNIHEDEEEIESIPAFMRKNIDLDFTDKSTESFLSGYSVKDDTNEKGEISTINTFLNGKKPD